MADLEAFRADTRSWLEANCPPGLVGRGANPLEGVWGGRKWTFSDPDRKLWLERMAEQGWTAPSWPREYISECSHTRSSICALVASSRAS